MNMSMRSIIPDSIKNDERLANRFKVKLSEALSQRMDESEWKKFSVLHELADWITCHPRFLRSLHWGDPDHEGLVLDLVSYLYDEKPEALMELFNQAIIQSWFRENENDLLKFWDSEPDPLILAISQSLEEVDEVKEIIDLIQHSNRIKNALPDDPYQAIGATKDMLEAAMKTILDRRGVSNIEKLNFSDLTTRCFSELGLTNNTEPTTDGERYSRKIASNAKKMIEIANELRNRAGTGHGRVVGREPRVTEADASLVASIGLILTAWLVKHNR